MLCSWNTIISVEIVYVSLKSSKSKTPPILAKKLLMIPPWRRGHGWLHYDSCSYMTHVYEIIDRGKLSQDLSEIIDFDELHLVSLLLTHLPPGPNICVSELGQHQFR